MDLTTFGMAGVAAITVICVILYEEQKRDD